MEHRPLIIIGSGPAGMASALFLQAQDPALARQALVLEKARHPRPKVCAGGLIPHTLDCLRELDVPLSVPHVVTHRARVEVPNYTVAYADQELCSVVRRAEFDQSLVTAGRQRGIEIREGEKVIEVRRENSGVRVETERGSYHARVVIGADGSGSLVRRRLVTQGRDCVGTAIMCDVPVASIDWSGFQEARYDFCFLAVRRGLRGYLWRFPCLIDGVAHANVGVYSVEAHGRGAQLRRVLAEELQRLHAPPVGLKAFPIRWYGRGVRVAAPHVLLAGDAAGVDSLMGEGISYSFEYGRRAAAAAAAALASGAFDFTDYEREVAGSWMGKKLMRLELGTRLFYSATWRLWFAFAARSRQAQEIGIRWYNGVDGWDRRSGWEALRAWWRADLYGTAAQRSLGSPSRGETHGVRAWPKE
jgi:flavin-dependent dehydrogenase